MSGCDKKLISEVLGLRTWITKHRSKLYMLYDSKKSGNITFLLISRNVLLHRSTFLLVILLSLHNFVLRPVSFQIFYSDFKADKNYKLLQLLRFSLIPCFLPRTAICLYASYIWNRSTRDNAVGMNYVNDQISPTRTRSDEESLS